MLKYLILIFSKWDFIAGLKCFFFFPEKCYPLLKREVEKVESRVKVLQIVETNIPLFKIFCESCHFDGFILSETPKPFVNTHSLSCFDGWERRVWNASQYGLLKTPVSPIFSLCVKHHVLTSWVLSGIFFLNRRDCMHWISWHRIASEAFLPQVILLGR